jgi:hypothetical protein
LWLRNRSTGEDVFIGVSDHVAQHLPEMLLRSPAPRSARHGPLHEYVTENVDLIEYRTAPCATLLQARRLEARLRAENPCRFSTAGTPLRSHAGTSKGDEPA